MQCAAANMCCCLQSRLTSFPQIPDFFHVLHFPSGLACQKPFFRAALLQGSPSSGQRFFRTFKAAAGVRDAQVQGVYLHLDLGPHMYHPFSSKVSLQLFLHLWHLTPHSGSFKCLLHSHPFQCSVAHCKYCQYCWMSAAWLDCGLEGVTSSSTL